MSWSPPSNHNSYYVNDPRNTNQYQTQRVVVSQPVQNGIQPQYQTTPAYQIQPHQITQAHPPAQGPISTSLPYNTAASYSSQLHQQQPSPQALNPQFINPSQLFHQPQQYQPYTQTSYSRQTVPLESKKLVAMAPIPAQAVSIDRPMLLISLAEEYFEAAHKLAPTTSLTLTTTTVEAYEKLISTGLGCLDTALKHVRLPPRTEATIRLRFAGVLYEETENYMDAETALSKGISLCERNHYYDLKYAMQFLLAQLMFEKNPKASLKALDSHINDAHAYQHYSWVYAMRFLRASYSLQHSGTLSDTHSALTNLRAIANLSSDQSDRAIYMTASLLEAMTHLRNTGADALESAQQAIAQVWTYQLDSTTRIPQLLGLAHILDVACSMRQGSPKVMMKKLGEMQQMMDAALTEGSWSTTSDLIIIPISRRENSSQVVSPDTRMILGIGDDGGDVLMVSFLNQNDAYAITYLLSGMVLLCKASGDQPKDQDQKAIKFLKAGLGSLRRDIQTCRSTSGLLSDFLAKRQWRGQISCYVSGCMAFCAAAAGSWADVKNNIDNLKASAQELDLSLEGPLGLLVTYLSGVFYQGVGDLGAALNIFQDKRFELPAQSAPAMASSSLEQVGRDISLLAALNTLWILQDGNKKNLTRNTALIARLEPFCANHLNQEIKTAYNLIVATVETNPATPLFKVKNYLKMALDGAQATANSQFLCITLNVMCSKFFYNVVGIQAEKSASAADHHAKKSGNPLWKSVATQMLSRALEVNGKKAESITAVDQARIYTSELEAAQTVPDLA